MDLNQYGVDPKEGSTLGDKLVSSVFEEGLKICATTVDTSSLRKQRTDAEATGIGQVILATLLVGLGGMMARGGYSDGNVPVCVVGLLMLALAVMPLSYAPGNIRRSRVLRFALFFRERGDELVREIELARSLHSQGVQMEFERRKRK